MATILEDSRFDPDRELKIVGTNPIKHDGTGDGDLTRFNFVPSISQIVLNML